MHALVIGEDVTYRDHVREALIRKGVVCATRQFSSDSVAHECHGPCRFDLVVVLLPVEVEPALTSIANHAKTAADVWVVGPATDSKLILRIMRQGADEYLDQEELESELTAALGKLAAQEQEPQQDGRVVGVLGPAGGSGASTVAANLAVLLHQQSDGGLLVDLRAAAGDQALLLDLQPRHNLADLCRKQDRMDQTMLERSLVGHACGLQLLAAPTRFEDSEAIESDGVVRVVQLARQMFSFTVLDLDVTRKESQMAAAEQTDVLLLVVRLDMTSLRNTQRVLDDLARQGIDDHQVQVVVNRQGQPKELSTRHVVDALGKPLLHAVPNDVGNVNASNNDGCPVVLGRPKSKVARSLAELASKIVNATSVSEKNGQAHHNRLENLWDSIVASVR